MSQKFLLVALLSLALLAFVVNPTQAATRLNCQSEIYQQATADSKDQFKKGYCFVKPVPLIFLKCILETEPILGFLPGTVRFLSARRIKIACPELSISQSRLFLLYI